MMINLLFSRLIAAFSCSPALAASAFTWVRTRTAQGRMKGMIALVGLMALVLTGCGGGGGGESTPASNSNATTYNVSKYTSLTTGASLSYNLTGTDTAGATYTGAIRTTVVGPTTFNGSNVIEKDTLVILTKTGVGVVLSTTEKAYYNADGTLSEIVFSDGVIATPTNAFVFPTTVQAGYDGVRGLSYSNGFDLTSTYQVANGSNGNANVTVTTTTNSVLSEVDTLTVTAAGDVPTITEVINDFPSTGVTLTLNGTESPSFGTNTTVYDVSKYTSLTTGASLSFTFTGTDTASGTYTGSLETTVVGPTTFNGSNVIEKDTLVIVTKTGVGVVLSTTEKAYYNADRTLSEIVFPNGVTATPVNAFVLPTTVQIGNFGGQSLDYSNGNNLTSTWQVVNGSNDNAIVTVATTTNLALSEVDTLTFTPTGDVPTITEVIYNFPSVGITTTLNGTEN